MSVIAIAEPDPILLRHLMEICREMGHQPYALTIPEGVTNKAPEIRPDVIITNFHPPEQVRSNIREWRLQLPDAKIIIVSGTRLDLAKEASNLDVCDYLKKPFLFSAFESCVQRACATP